MIMDFNHINEPIWLLDENFKVIGSNSSARNFEVSNAIGKYVYDALLLLEECKVALASYISEILSVKKYTFFTKPVKFNVPWLKEAISVLHGFTLNTVDGLRYLIFLKVYDIDEYLRVFVVERLKDFKMDNVKFVIFDRCCVPLFQLDVEKEVVNTVRHILVESLENDRMIRDKSFDIHGRWYSLRIYPLLLSEKSLELDKLIGYMAVLFDETDKVKLLRELNFNSSLTERILNSSGFIFILAKNNRILRVNRSVSKIVGYGDDELVKLAPWDLVYGPDRSLVVADMVAAMEGELDDRKVYEVRLIKKGGDTVWVKLAVDSLTHDDGNYCVIVGYDVEDFKRLEEELKRLSAIDELTGVYNRRALNEFLGILIKQCERYGDKLSIMLIDLDDFKAVNDRYGHVFGDKVLEEFVKVLKGLVRESDIVARYGGDEFVVIMPKTDVSSAKFVAERILAELSKVALLDVIKISVSIGLTEYTVGDDLESIFKRADEALYESKIMGKRRVSAR
ncbi:MAG: diguanylate cyclase [Thermosulfidibacteraceae bacterium]|jgi:diguanylate cyclase (GGDEF)-like protein/PAS domain S-box-containing protein